MEVNTQVILNTMVIYKKTVNNRSKKLYNIGPWGPIIMDRSPVQILFFPAVMTKARSLQSE
jgi:hypothetical protein